MPLLAAPEPAAVAERDDAPVELDPPVAPVVAVDDPADDEDDAAAHDTAVARPGSRSVPPPRRKGKGRATVPSWDEILFGAPRPHAD